MSICIGKKVWFVPSLFADPVPVIVTGIENINPNLKNRLYLTTKTSNGKIISGYVQQFSTSKPKPYNADIETGLSSVYYDYSQNKPVTKKELILNFEHYHNKYISTWKTAEEMIEHLITIGILVSYTEYLTNGGN